MPMFSSIRDSRGRFVGHEATTQLARSFEAGLNGNPGEWQRAQEILHRLGWDQFSFMRKYGSQIPFRPSMAVAPPPPGAGHQSGSQSNAQVVMFYKDIHSMSSDIHNILKMQQRVGGGGGGAPPPPWTHYTTPGPWGGLHIGATRGRMPTGGGAGGGGGWFGGGGGFAGGGGGFGAGALRGMLPPGFRRLAGEAGAGFVGFELLKAMINPVGFGFENIIHPLATASKRAWDFRRTMFGAAGPGGDPSAFTARIAPGLMPSLGIGRDATLPTWMHQLGMGPEDALSLAGQYGIRGRSADENVRNLQMLGAAREGLTDRFQGFRGMDPASIVSMARTGMARGLGGTGELANSTFLDSFSETMKTAYAEGADRATVFAHMEESLQMLSKAGATGISGTSLNALFDIMLKSGLPGGRTGEAAQAMVGGTLGAIQTIGQDTRRSIVASMLYSKYGGDLEKMVGPDVMKNLTPVQAKALAEAKDLAKRGAVIPAFELLAKGVLSSDTGVLRWQQLSKEGAQLAMPNIPGMRTLFGAGTAGVNVGDWLGAQIGADTKGSGIVRGGMAEKMWGWLKSHGYTDQAAAAVIGNASQESSLDPNVMNKAGDWGLFQFAPGGELPGYRAWAAANGKDPSDWQSQMEYMDIRTGQLLPGFKTSIGVDLAGTFATGFERPNPAYANMGRRRALARTAMGTFSGAGGAL